MTSNIRKVSEEKSVTKETLLTPRFYTTNFEEMARLDISSNQSEIKAIVEEFRIDYNRNHFLRDKEFLSTWNNSDANIRNIFIEFLERSCTAEFSGFLLYKEIARNLKQHNPLLAEGFSYMSRDEARHAGFLNKAMSDFNISLDLGFLTKARKYTFFSPKFIFYATYLSEKIGYWRYITIYRHLEKNPTFRISPLFRFFESWCQDENRHGDFFAAILKSQKPLLTTYSSKLWCKFFLLSVFVTMYLNDFQRSDFYSLLGLNVKQFDQYVIRKTNQSSGTIFPIILDLDHPLFFNLLDLCVDYNVRINAPCKNNVSSVVEWKTKLEAKLLLLWSLIRLYLLPGIETRTYS